MKGKLSTLPKQRVLFDKRKKKRAKTVVVVDTKPTKEVGQLYFMEGRKKRK